MFGWTDWEKCNSPYNHSASSLAISNRRYLWILAPLSPFHTILKSFAAWSHILEANFPYLPFLNSHCVWIDCKHRIIAWSACNLPWAWNYDLTVPYSDTSALYYLFSIVQIRLFVILNYWILQNWVNLWVFQNSELQNLGYLKNFWSWFS